MTGVETKTGTYGFSRGRSRREVLRPDDPLYRAFEKWLEGAPETVPRYLYDSGKREVGDLYRSARRVLSKIDLSGKSPEEINSVLMSFRNDKRLANAGLFLTAAYNKLDQKDIVFDLNIDQPVSYVGFRLGKGRSLVLKSDTGEWIGTESLGVLVNYANIGGEMAYCAEAPAVNFGEVGEWMSLNAKAPAVNFGEVGEGMGLWAKAPAVNFGEVGGEMALEAKGKVYIALKNPKGEFHRNGEINLDEDECKQHPRLVKYFEELKKEFERFKTAGYPECLGVVDLVRERIGDNEKFEGIIRGLL